MALPPGSRFGTYDIVSQLGVGGMGEVYRARDPQLKRDVAIKILPADVTADADRLARFQREAEILASLNHPNIAQVFGIADANGVRGIVMELAEGQTLAELLSRGPLPLSEALGIARQIAEALEMAHDRGIVHRDLKPANVMMTPDSVVKVLDFGLAKALNATPDSTAQAATFSSPAMTRAGIILGTAAYMSPEQARGRTVDARTDIWAFGCVLFEMLTGRRPFDGETVTDILGAIVHKEPEWSLLPAILPDSLRRLLERCLAKDQKQRLHNIADVRLEIQDLLARPHTAGSTASSPRPGRSAISTREGLAWAVAVVSLVAAASAVALLRTSASSIGDGRPALRLSILPTEGGEVGVPAISPDGRRVAYPALRADGMPVIWVRDLDQSTAKPLAGTQEGGRLFWSPDSKRLGFVVNGVLKHVSADGGPVQEIARPVRVGASWGAGDVVLFGSGNGQIHRVSAAGGTPVALTTLQGPSWEHMWPSMLPDGKHFLFTAKNWAGLAESGAQGIYLGSLDNPSETPRQLLSELSAAVYAPPGFLVFTREGQLMAAPFDAVAGRITGEPIALGETVAFDASFYTAAVSAAANGTLAIRPPPAPSVANAAGPSGSYDAELTLLKRDGSVVSRFGGIQKFSYYMALSPDGRAAVAQVSDERTSASDLWRFDVESGARVPLTSMRTNGGYAGAPAWSSDGARLAFACQPPGVLDDVCVRDMRSHATTTVIKSKASWEHPVAWSTDGQFLLVDYDPYTGSSSQELYVWSSKTGTLSPFIKESDVHEAVFSPDTRFVAFSSAETSRTEVYVTTFPERRQTWPVTTDGGRVISWSADGKELLVATLNGHIEAYPVDTSGGSFSAGAPKVLVRNVGFDVRYARATPDHSRILIRVPKDADKDHGEIRLLFGWAKSLAR
jgi:eukaryotic-like serine/threonine-protein kinase